MKRFQWALAMLLVLAAQCAFADSVLTFNITQATVFVGTGSDNVAFTLTGPGISISDLGGIQCQLDWCDGQIFPPGTAAPGGFGFGGQIFLEGPSDVNIGGHDLGDSLGLDLITLNTSGGFTFPTNTTVGSIFTGCQPAAIGPSSITGDAGEGDTFTQFVLLPPASGKFCSTWDFVPASGESSAGFQFTGGKFVASTVPEPGTLGLIGSGLLGIVGAVLRKRGCKRAPN